MTSKSAICLPSHCSVTQSPPCIINRVQLVAGMRVYIQPQPKGQCLGPAQHCFQPTSGYHLLTTRDINENRAFEIEY